MVTHPYRSRWCWNHDATSATREILPRRYGSGIMARMA